MGQGTAWNESVLGTVSPWFSMLPLLEPRMHLGTVAHERAFRTQIVLEGPGGFWTGFCRSQGHLASPFPKSGKPSGIRHM